MNKNNNFFLTLDLEEWYHLEYLKNNVDDKKDVMVKSIIPFLDFLSENDIKITVFILGELIEGNRELISRISANHEIAIHGWDHELLYEKEKNKFQKEIKKTKDLLEEISGNEVIGYRAPCFSMSNEKIEWLREIGIKYDSSYIKFKEHSLYGDLTMDDFEKVDNLVYQKEGFFEFEMPTQKILNKDIPISGGGYFRMFPKWLYKYLWNKNSQENKNFNMYIHPFELTNLIPDYKFKSVKNKIRFSIGRKNNLEKMFWFLFLVKKRGYNFTSIKDYLESNNLVK